MEHFSVDFLTRENRDNLLRLAAYALSLPDDYEHFNMETFGDPDPGDGILPVACGTAACMVGHSLAAGMRPPHDAEEKHSWTDYSWNLYTAGEWIGNSDLIVPASITPSTASSFHSRKPEMVAAILWNWLFSGRWIHSDNTARGGAARIYYALEHGVPENWWMQMSGVAPLCYERTLQDQPEKRREPAHV